MRKFPAQKLLDRNDYVIVAGDFGLLWDGWKEDRYWLKWLEAKPFTTLFIDGNHENFDLLESYPVTSWNGGKVRHITEHIIHLMRGQVYEINGKTFFAFGGAASHDKEYRKEGRSWWSREMPSPEEYEEGLRNLERHHWQVDYVITHTCSFSSLSWLTAQYGIHIEPDQMHTYFEQVQQQLTYSQWFFGHYHRDTVVPNKQRLIYTDIIQVL